MATGLVLFYAFLIGCVCGLRSMTAPAVIAWGARLGWLHLGGGLLAFFASKISLVIFSLFAVGELIADKLPFIPGRTQIGPLGVRIIFGALCGAALCLSSTISPGGGAILGGLGGVAGAFAGYNYRRLLSRGAKVPGFLIALLEDLVAVGGGLLIVSRW
jgi:uncharacterized membrane protein